MPRLLRAPCLVARRSGAARSTPVRMVWHDTADGALAAGGLALCETAGKAALWRIERLAPGEGLDWLPCHAAPVLAEAVAPEALDWVLPGPLAPVAAFAGRVRVLGLALPGGAGQLGIVCGSLRGVAVDRPACRMSLSGPLADVAALAGMLAETLPLRVPGESLAAQAMALVRGGAAPRRSFAPALPPGIAAGDGLACIAAQLAGGILHWARLVPGADSAVPVHQMRVGVRRLRSALSVFRRAAEDAAGACAWLDAMAAELRALAARLGAARDWDVFLGETGAAVDAAFPQDRRIAQLLAAAGRKRVAAYGDLRGYLAGQDWTRLAVRLALLPTLRPWDAQGNRAVLEGACAAYATRALDRRLKHVLAQGGALAGLQADALHDIRKQAKRLRYATEFFGPLFADRQVRRYLPRLEQLQETLGRVNDTATAAALMGQLGGGADRAFAAGVVQGFGAARARRAEARVQRAWARFARAAPFWD